MPVESISGSVTSFKMPSLPVEVKSGKSPVELNSTKDQPSAKAGPANITDTLTNDKVSVANKTLSIVGVEKNSKPAGVVSHVVVSYNQRGEMRTKFEDSRNNVVYQIPSEMVAKMQDLMMTTSTSTDVKG